LLAALLLQVAAGASASADASRIRNLFEICRSLCPASIGKRMELPEPLAFKQALTLLPAPPDVVSQQDPHVLSYLYQFFCSPSRETARRNLQTADKAAGLEEIVSFTQLYTPHAITTRLLQHCLPSTTAGRADDFRLLDPACGAGNFLLSAFDLLSAGSRSPSLWQKILFDQLYGCDLDENALWTTALAFAARVVKAQVPVDLRPLNLALVTGCDGNGSTLGSLHPHWPASHILAQTYDAVVGNPPYIGRKLLERALKHELRRHYPDCRHDLCTAFIERGLGLLRPGGRLCYITQSSMLYLPTYERLRRKLVENFTLVEIVEAGAGVFPLQGGEKVNSMMICIENTAPRRDHHVIFRDETTSEHNQYRCLQSSLLSHRKVAFNYRTPPVVLFIREKSARLVQLADIRQGLATSDNQRFVKLWWQVPAEELGRRWVPYVKGGGSHRWFAPIETVVDWGEDGQRIKAAVAESYPYLNGKTGWVVKNERFYFREGLTFSLVNTRQLSVRYLPPGCIFDVAGSAVFCNQDQQWWLLAYMNSAFISACAQLLNPTINFQVGDLKELPMVALSDGARAELEHAAKQCVADKRLLCGMPEEAGDGPLAAILSPPPQQRLMYSDETLAQARQRLLQNEHHIDKLVMDELVRNLDLTAACRSELEQLCLSAAARRKL
jgi:hypothetical protein